jgi:hypothetical protein
MERGETLSQGRGASDRLVGMMIKGRQGGGMIIDRR